MALADVIKLVDQLSPEELHELRDYIHLREQQLQLRAVNVNMEALLSVLEEIRAGISDEEFAEIERLMNAEVQRNDGS